MYNPNNLSFDVWTLIVDKMRNEDLFKLLSGPDAPLPVKIKNKEPIYPITNKSFANHIRATLFKRRGEDASNYQNLLLEQWLKECSKENKLSFIHSDADKRALLNLLDDALKNPSSTVQNRIRCCLLINRLHPAPNDITPTIIQRYLLAVQKNPYINIHFKTYVTEFADNEIQQIFTTIVTKSRTDDHFDILSDNLKAITPHTSAPERNKLLSHLLEKLKLNYKDGLSLNEVTTLCVLAELATEAECNELIAHMAKLMDKTNNMLIKQILSEALGKLAPKASSYNNWIIQQSLLTYLSEYTYVPHKETMRSLRMSIPYADTDDLISMIEPIKIRLKNILWEIQLEAVQALGELACRVPFLKREYIVQHINEFIKKTDFYITRYAAIDAINKIARKVSYEARDKMAEAWQRDVGSSHIRASVTLGELAPHLDSAVRNDIIKNEAYDYESMSQPFVHNETGERHIKYLTTSGNLNEMAANQIVVELQYYLQNKIEPTSLGIDIFNGIIRSLIMLRSSIDFDIHDALLPAIEQKLNHQNISTREKTLTYISQLAPYINPNKKKTLISLISKMLVANQISFNVAIFALSKLLKHTHHEERSTIITMMTDQFNNADHSHHLSAIKALSELADDASQKEANEWIDPIISLLNDTNDQVQEEAYSALCKCAPHANKAVSHKIFRSIVGMLNDTNPTKFHSAYSVTKVIMPSLSEEHLNEILTLQDDYASKLNLKLLAQTRLHLLLHPDIQPSSNANGVYFLRTKASTNTVAAPTASSYKCSIM